MMLSVNDTSLYVSRTSVASTGRMPALVLHGGLGWDHSYLTPWLDHFSDILDLVYYDHRGNGRSARPDDWSDVSHHTWVDDAEALRVSLGFDRALLFGHSYGSFLALEYAIRFPDRVAGLVLCSTAPAIDYFETAIANARRRATDAQFMTLMKAMGDAPPTTDAELRAHTECVLPIYLHAPDDPLASTLLADVRYSRDAFVHAMANCLPRFDLRNRLHELRVPTLIVSGAEDWLTPPDLGGARVSAAIPAATHLVFPRSGHFAFAEEPSAFQDALRAWLVREKLVGAPNCATAA